MRMFAMRARSVRRQRVCSNRDKAQQLLGTAPKASGRRIDFAARRWDGGLDWLRPGEVRAAWMVRGTRHAVLMCVTSDSSAWTTSVKHGPFQGEILYPPRLPQYIIRSCTRSVRTATAFKAREVALADAADAHGL